MFVSLVLRVSVGLNSLFISGGKSAMISLSDFGLIWRDFGWANQTLATVVLWTAAVYLAKERKFHWVATLPAVFMTVVVTTFIANSGIGLSLSMAFSTSAGIGAGVIALILFFWHANRLPLPPKIVRDPGT